MTNTSRRERRHQRVLYGQANIDLLTIMGKTVCRWIGHNESIKLTKGSKCSRCGHWNHPTVW